VNSDRKDPKQGQLPQRRTRLGLFIALALLPPLANAEVEANASPRQLDAIEVVGRSLSGTYYADEAAGAKTALPLRELPQSVRVLSRQAIDDLGALRLSDTVDYVGGVSRQNNFGGLWDNLALRGLPGNENTGSALLLNGFSANRGLNAPRDTADVERFEFLKGPASALYGSSEPGGTVNVVSKRPLWRSASSLELYGGSHDFRRVALDSTGPAGEQLAWRVNAAIEDRDSFRDVVNQQRRLLAPAFTWKLGLDTEINYVGQWLRHEAVLDRGVPAVDGQLGVVPIERFNGEPGDGRVRLENAQHQLSLEHVLNEAWALRGALSRKDSSLLGFSTEPSLVEADGRTLRRQRRFRDYESDDTAVQAEAVGRFEGARISHELLLGVEHYRFDLRQLMMRVNPTATAPYAIDLLTPVYGQPLPTPLPNTDSFEQQRSTAFYLQEALSLGERWRLIAALRGERFQQDFENRRNGRRTELSLTQWAPRLGLSWLGGSGFTVFANVGESFRPNAGSDVNGVGFEAESGRAFEMGAKWEHSSGDFGATVAAFNIDKSNVLTGDPANPGFSIVAGEVRSRGIEFDASGRLGEHWRLNAAWVQLDAEVRRDNVLEIGSPLINVPRRNGSVLAVHERALGSGVFGLGGGLTHVGERAGETRTRAEAAAGVQLFRLPAYTTAKLVAYWKPNDRISLSLDVDNLFDREHYVSSVFRTWVTPGEARRVTVGAQVRF
jgi:iron complex outermembrane receptor protein